MKRMLLLAVICGSALMSVLAACGTRYAQSARTVAYEDGVYRGVFIDGDEIQVNVQFALEGNRVQSIGFRRLYAKGDDYLHAEEGSLEARLRDEYRTLLDHLLGKDIRAHLSDLHTPEDIASDVDGLTAATMRSSKLVSAIRDGLNRGVYSY